MYYKRSKHNFFRNIFTNKMTKYYFAILLVFLLFFGLTLDYVFESLKRENSSTTSQEATTNQNTAPTEDATTQPSSTQATTEAKPALPRHKIAINKATNICYIYELTEDSSYTLIKAFACSVAENIEPIDGLSINSKHIWKPIDDTNYSQYASRISDVIVIQSLPFNGTNKDKIVSKYYNKLQTNTKDNNNIYMLTGDAFWIYNTCSLHTPVSIYYAENEILSLQPDNRPRLPRYVSWDPSDPDPNNVWIKTKLGKFKGIKKQRTVNVGDDFDVYAGVKAYDAEGYELSSHHIFYIGSYDINTPGEYEITYVMVDIFGTIKMWDSNIIVVNPNMETTSTVIE